MKQCKCGSYALNLHKEGIDQGELCDRHYWQARAETAEKDAARYRFVRMNRLWLKASLPYIAAPELDAAIDAAIAKDAP